MGNFTFSIGRMMAAVACLALACAAWHHSTRNHQLSPFQGFCLFVLMLGMPCVAVWVLSRNVRAAGLLFAALSLLVIILSVV